MPTTWAILTGEYPPQPGGVADYTKQVAEALSARGDIVHVFAPAESNATVEPYPTSQKGVHVHRLHGHFDRAARRLTQHAIQSLATRRRVLVQYVPHAFGMRGMNVGFALWIGRLARRGEVIDVMFHEVLYPTERGQPLKHRLLALVTRQMAKRIASVADRIFVSIPKWGVLLRQIGITKSVRWLPVPANIRVDVNPQRVFQIRQRFSNGALIGHFGTYGKFVADILNSTLVPLLERNPLVNILLLGRGSNEFAERLHRKHPTIANRVHSTGQVQSGEIADHLAACDFVFQPYPDGVSSRRGSVMASLALGVPVLTCAGELTEPLWAESQAVFLASEPTAVALIAAVELLSASPQMLEALGSRGKKVYSEYFDRQVTIDALATET